MEYILVLLIVALLNGAIAYIDGLMEGIIPLTLYAEQYMSTLAGVDLFQSLFDIVFGFGVSLIVLKFLKKGFETYVLWSDGDADEEPIAILTNFFKAMAVAICFPTMYDWLATIVEEMSNKMLEAIGLATAYDWAGWVSGISTMGLVTAIFGLVFVIVYFILYFQFLMRGLEILILRVGIPLACVGLIDNDKGVFNKMAAIRWRGSDLDASYHAALFLMASHPALFQKMDRYLCPEGIDFTKMMRKEEFEYDWMKITADAARNLFSWNSKCAATPFEISRMPAPAIRALFTACFIANGDYMVSVRENDKGEKVFEIDDSAGKRREAFNLQMEQMMEAPGMEPD